MDVYRIGVTISMVNNASVVLGVIQRDVLKLQESVDMLTGGFTTAKEAAAGLGTALGGDTGLAVIDRLVGQGKELVRQQGLAKEQLRHMPAMTPILPAGGRTNASTHLLATSESEDFKDAHQLTAASGKAAEAQGNLPFNVKAPLMGSVPCDEAQGQPFDLTKPPTAPGSSQNPSPITPLNGGISPSSLSDLISSALARGINASGGSASIAGTGNPLQPAVQSLTGRVMTGVPQGDADGAPESRASANLSGDHTAQEIGVQFAKKQARFQTDSSPDRGTSGICSRDVMQNDPITNIKTFQETWNNLLTALGGPLMDTASNLMVSLTHVVNDLSQWAAAHPELIGAIEKTVGALAGLATAAGVFAIGAKAATALDLLTGPAGLIGLAASIETLGKALPSLPSWLEHLAAGSATGVAVGSAASVVGTTTAATNGAGLGLPRAGATGEPGGRVLLWWLMG
jgi:hypothetical protein